MFGWPARSWFYNCTKLVHQEYDEKSRWLADILSDHGERIVAELDVQRVLSDLLYERVFSLEEYRDILSQECCKKRAACFVEKLSGKGPRAFSAFCATLEESCPQLLTSLLLDYPGVTNRSVPDTSFENSERREASEMDVREIGEASDPDGNPFAEDQTNHSFNKYSSNPYPDFATLTFLPTGRPSSQPSISAIKIPRRLSAQFPQSNKALSGC